MSSKDVLLLPHESKKKPNEIHTEVIDPPLPGSIERVCIYHEGMICSRENASVEERADHVLYYYSSCSRGHRHLPSQHTNGRNGALENGLMSQIYPKMHHFSWNPSHLNEHNHVQGSHTHVQGSHNYVHGSHNNCSSDQKLGCGSYDSAPLARAEEAMQFSGFCQALSSFVKVLHATRGGQSNNSSAECKFKERESSCSYIRKVHLSGSTIIYNPLEIAETGESTISQQSPKVIITAQFMRRNFEHNTHSYLNNDLGYLIDNSNFTNREREGYMDFGGKLSDPASLSLCIREWHRLFRLLNREGIIQRLNPMFAEEQKGNFEENHDPGASAQIHQQESKPTFKSLVRLRKSAREAQFKLERWQKNIQSMNVEQIKQVTDEQAETEYRALQEFQRAQQDVDHLLSRLPLHSLYTDLASSYDARLQLCRSICISYWINQNPVPRNKDHNNRGEGLSAGSIMSLKRTFRQSLESFDMPLKKIVQGGYLFVQNSLISSLSTRGIGFEQVALLPSKYIVPRESILTLYRYLSRFGRFASETQSLEDDSSISMNSDHQKTINQCNNQIVYNESIGEFLSPPLSVSEEEIQSFASLSVEDFGVIWTPKVVVKDRPYRVVMYKVSRDCNIILFLDEMELSDYLISAGSLPAVALFSYFTGLSRNISSTLYPIMKTAKYNTSHAALSQQWITIPSSPKIAFFYVNTNTEQFDIDNCNMKFYFPALPLSLSAKVPSSLPHYADNFLNDVNEFLNLNTDETENDASDSGSTGPRENCFLIPKHNVWVLARTFEFCKEIYILDARTYRTVKNVQEARLAISTTLMLREVKNAYR